MFQTINELQAVTNECATVRDPDVFHVGFFSDNQGKAVDAMYLQHQFVRTDAVTGNLDWGYGRKWHISHHATVSEVVMTCLKATITNAEHEEREGFTYRGIPIFQPHVNVEQLVETMLEGRLGSDARRVLPGVDRAALLG